MMIAVMLIIAQYGISQNHEIPTNAIAIDENTIIKDTSGKKVELSELMDMMNSGEWGMDPVNDSEGKLLYLQLRKASDGEKMKMKEMPMGHNDSDLIGKQAPDFKITDINGNEISTKDAKGKVIVLNFWFIACKPCVAEIPDLNKVYEKYKTDPNVVFASITFDNLDQVKSFLQQNPIAYPIVADGKEMANLFKISGYPTNIVIDKNGNYFDYLMGGHPQIGSQISNSIKKALSGYQPDLKSPQAKTMRIDSESTFKLENGKTVPFTEVIEMLNSNAYDLELKQEEGGEYYLLKKKK